MTHVEKAEKLFKEKNRWTKYMLFNKRMIGDEI